RAACGTIYHPAAAHWAADSWIPESAARWVAAEGFLRHPDAVDHVPLPDLHHHVEPFGDLAEDGVHPVEMRLRGMGDEELATTGVLAGVGHRERAGLVLVRIAGGFALDLP